MSAEGKGPLLTEQHNPMRKFNGRAPGIKDDSSLELQVLLQLEQDQEKQKDAKQSGFPRFTLEDDMDESEYVDTEALLGPSSPRDAGQHPPHHQQPSKQRNGHHSLSDMPYSHKDGEYQDMGSPRESRRAAGKGSSSSSWGWFGLSPSSGWETLPSKSHPFLSAWGRSWLLPKPVPQWGMWLVLLLGLLPLAVAAVVAINALVIILRQHHWGGGPSIDWSGPPTASPQCSATSPRTYCGSGSMSKGVCEKLGCCWAPGIYGIDHEDVPPCFRPNVEKGLYAVKSRTSTDTGVEMALELSQGIHPNLGSDFQQLVVVVEEQTPSRLHVKIMPAPSDTGDTPRWEVPEELMPRPPSMTKDELRASGQPVKYMYELPQPGSMFDLRVTRSLPSAPGGASHWAPIIDTTGWGLVFKQQYMEFTTTLEKGSALYGLGESVQPTGLRLPRNGRVMTLWNTDSAAAGPYGVSLYGSHPFYLEVRQGHNATGAAVPGAVAAHGVFLLNSNGMDVELHEEHLTYRVIGGVLDFYIFMGPSPEEVIQQYQEVIGRPSLPPLWALGFHQSKYGYPNVEYLLQVVKAYHKAQIPLDVIWSDIDYMSAFMLFTLDAEKYPVDMMRSLIDWLHSNGQHWVPILDAAVKWAPGVGIWDEGASRGLFVRNPTTGSSPPSGAGTPYLGQVWPGISAWPDFLNPETVTWWGQKIGQFLGTVPADGLWLDMNEPSNFATGVVCTPPKSQWVILWRAFTKQPLPDCTPPREGDLLSLPPYSINIGRRQRALGSNTIGMPAQHYNGWQQYDTHNLYSLSEAKATYQALVNATNKRPFILTRSSFPGSGRYAAHWTGDNGATWNDLGWAITGVLNSNMYGMPFTGSDICGFLYDTTEELCARWLEAGAFHPFSRDHSDRHAVMQEAYRWPLTTTAARAALALRYRLLPYLYSSLYLTSTQGGTFARPLFFEWPGDQGASAASDTQWLLGSSILIAPVIRPSVTRWPVTFPPGCWFAVQTLGNETAITGPLVKEVDAPVGRPPVYLRSGAIVPLASKPGLTVHQTMASPLQIVAAFAGECSDPGSAGTTAGGGSSGSGSSSSSSIAASKSSAGGASESSTGGESSSTYPSPALAHGSLYMDDGTTLAVGDPAVTLSLVFHAGCTAKLMQAGSGTSAGSHSSSHTNVSADGLSGWLWVEIPEAHGHTSHPTAVQQTSVTEVLMVGMPRVVADSGTAALHVDVTVQLTANSSTLTGSHAPVQATAVMNTEAQSLKITLSRPVPLMAVQSVTWRVRTAAGR